MRTFDVVSILDNRYWIGDYDYGYRICEVSFIPQDNDKLTDEQVYELCEKFAAIIAAELESKEEEL